MFWLQIQLNLMEPPQDAYYVNQQSMQGLVSDTEVFKPNIYRFIQHVYNFQIGFLCRDN